MEKLEQRIKNLEEQLEDIKRNMPEDQLSMVVFSRRLGSDAGGIYHCRRRSCHV